jgi:hypothetical protein
MIANAAPTLASFAGIHRGETIVVCGCGPSLNGLERPEQFVTIGVNDVGRRFDPSYLVVVNPPSQFAPGRFRYVQESKARYLFSQLDLGAAAPPAVRFRLGHYGGTTFDDPGVLHYTRNSPYVALCLAVHMGARRIGLVGVDFTDDHFFGATGPHVLAGQLPAIDAEYRALATALAARGVEVTNLSPASRLTAFPKRQTAAPAPAAPRRVFAVTYRFLACGNVISDGLRRAAAAKGIAWQEAAWDDPRLPALVEQFDPDLLLVVHGRRFVQRWGTAFETRRSAVWLLDEPYEVDDTATFSSRFTHVFVNDAATIGRHTNAIYLPVCHDPSTHYPGTDTPRYDVGFVGGANPTRERLLGALARQGLLSYVVGGPWHDPNVNRLSLSRNVPPEETAELYRSTRIVVNVFRDLHHFNRDRLAGRSLNPRIYEALACGALVVSEARPELEELVPELPVFRTEQELVAVVERLLSDEALRQQTRDRCLERVRPATYAARLQTVLDVTADTAPPPALPAPPPAAEPKPPRGWELCAPIDWTESDGDLVLRAAGDGSPGSERGIVTMAPHRDACLSFEVMIAAGACFVAKINQAAKLDQRTNSYHLYCDGGAYLARHFCVFRTVDLPRGQWIRLRLAHAGGVLTVSHDDRVLASVRDDALREGFAFLGVKRGEVRLRAIDIAAADPVQPDAPPRLDGLTVCEADAALRPRVSIVTTVYDRVSCLANCLRSVRGLHFQDYEHIVVSDAPPGPVVAQIEALVRSLGDRRLSYVNLAERHNNWGIAPAAVGLRRARGEFVGFLSDDNGYTPDHLSTLVRELDADHGLGFVYSSCRYAGRLVLRHPVPAPARIDLGQPLFRRELLRRYLNDDLPFSMMAWDWAMIETLVARGVGWKHVDVPSFIFRLACYPQLVAQT